MEGKKILFGFSGSFCNHHKCIAELKKLAEKNDVTVVVSKNVAALSTRFYNHIEFLNECETISGHQVIKDIVTAEWVGPKDPFDIMCIAPMSASCTSRLVYGNYDCPVTLAAKAMIRNEKNVVVAIASNNALGISGKNIFHLLNYKHIYFVPLAQDDPLKKPNSLVARFELLEATMDQALNHQQIQPLLWQGGNA